MESEETLRFNLTLAYNTILKVAPIKANKTHIQRALSVPPYEKWELRVEKHLGRANKAAGRISHRHSPSLFLSLSPRDDPNKLLLVLFEDCTTQAVGKQDL